MNWTLGIARLLVTEIFGFLCKPYWIGLKFSEAPGLSLVLYMHIRYYTKIFSKKMIFTFWTAVFVILDPLFHAVYLVNLILFLSLLLYTN